MGFQQNAAVVTVCYQLHNKNLLLCTQYCCCDYVKVVEMGRLMMPIKVIEAFSAFMEKEISSPYSKKPFI
jgi:hypothetical protein